MWSFTRAHLTLYHPIEHHGGLPEETDINTCWERVISFDAPLDNNYELIVAC